MNRAVRTVLFHGLLYKLAILPKTLCLKPAAIELLSSMPDNKIIIRNKQKLHMNWISPQTVTGSPAEGLQYLRRPHINKEFWERIANGEHLLICAPRRVGKSSVMKDLAKSPPEGYLVIYQNIESDKTQKDFFKRLLVLILEQMGSRLKLRENISLWLRSRTIGELSINGVVAFTKNEIDFKEELLGLIREIKKTDLHIVILLDEFPDVIHSILQNEGKSAAIDTLHTLRSIRHSSSMKQFSFVFAGSIGIGHVVSMLDRPSLINDLRQIHISELNRAEGRALLAALLTDVTMQVGNEETEYLFSKITYLLPYYIQLMVEKCDQILRAEQQPKLSIRHIDKAFDRIVREVNNFDDWEIRLSRYFHSDDSHFCIQMLTRCAHSQRNTLQEAHDLSLLIRPRAGYKHLLDTVLEREGYLVHKETRYFFLSPFLQEWWKDRHPAFEIIY